MKTRSSVIHFGFITLIGLSLIALYALPSAESARADWAASAPNAGTIPMFTNTVYLPLVMKPATTTTTCDPISTETYGTLSVNPPPTDRHADQHADLNLGLRGYTPTTATLGLISINGSNDPRAPQFPGFFADNRTPTFTSVAQAYNWDFSNPPPGRRTTPISNPTVTLLGMGTTAGEVIRVPDSGYLIGSGYQTLVLYAAANRITLKYTRDDNVISGYTIHVENVCVEPRLLALYQSSNSAGRGQLPALRGLQPFGRASGAAISAAIQDNGTWLDPRSRKDWWTGR